MLYTNFVVRFVFFLNFDEVLRIIIYLLIHYFYLNSLLYAYIKIFFYKKSKKSIIFVLIF